MSTYFRTIPTVLPANTRTVTTVAEFDAAYAATTSGVDSKIILQAGTYGAFPTTQFNRSLAKAKLQIVAATGAHVIIKGAWDIIAADIWVIGLEFDQEYIGCNPGDIQGGSLITTGGGGTNFNMINCFAHRGSTNQSVTPHCGNSGLLDTSNMTGSLIYGNVFTDCRHTVYLANTNAGFKHYIRNYIGDVNPGDLLVGNAFNIHAYSSSSLNNIQNMHFVENIVANGSNLLGSDGGSGIVRGIEFVGNIFHDSNYAQYNRTQELRFENNRMYNCRGTCVNLQHIHGSPEQTYGYQSPTVYKGNLIHKVSSSQHFVTIRPVIYNASNTRLLGSTGVFYRSVADEPDVGPNTYYGTWLSSVTGNGFFAAGVSSLGDHQNFSNMHGNTWDAGSSVTPGSPPDYQQIILNEYDDNRAMLFVWNQDGAGTVTVNMPDDRQAEIYPIRSGGWGVPDYTGSNTYNISPSGLDGNAYIGLIKFTGGTEVQILVPNATTTNADGVTDLGGGTTNIFQSIDETVANDTDGVRSVLAPTSDIVVFKYSAGSDPVTSSNHFFVNRYSKDASGGAQIDITAQLRLSYVNEGALGTAITTRTYTNVSENPTTDTYTLSGAEADAITDYTALYVRYIFNQV